MLFGLVLLAASTAFLCVAKNIPLLLVGRALQGICAALTWTVGLALVIDTVDRKHIGRATGWIGMATSLGVLLAPLLGGVVYGTGGYYAVFAMCFGLLAVDIVLRLAIIEVREARQWLDDVSKGPSLPTAGGIKTEQELPAPTATTADGADVEKKDAPDVEPQRPAPMPTVLHGFKSLLGLLRKPRLLAALWGTLAHSLVITCFDSILPLLVESLFHWNSIGAGLIFLPLVVPMFLSPLIGSLGDRYGAKWLASSGFVLATPFLVCLRFIGEDNMGQKVLLCVLLAGIGVALALVFGPLMAEITWSVLGDADDDDDGDDEESKSSAPYGLAYGLYNMAFSGGSMLGPLMGGMIRDAAGIDTVGWSVAIVTIATAVTQFLWIGKPVGSLWRRSS
jgi:MFS family permease